MIVWQSTIDFPMQALVIDSSCSLTGAAILDMNTTFWAVGLSE